MKNISSTYSVQYQGKHRHGSILFSKPHTVGIIARNMAAVPLKRQDNKKKEK